MPNRVRDCHGSGAQNSSCSPGFIVGIDLGGTKAAERARAGERSAVEAWHSLGQRLAWLLGMLGRVVDPDLFVVGGSLSRAWELFASDIQQISSRWPVRLSSDPEGMTMRGAGSMATAVSIQPKPLNHR